MYVRAQNFFECQTIYIGRSSKFFQVSRIFSQRSGGGDAIMVEGSKIGGGKGLTKDMKYASAEIFQVPEPISRQDPKIFPVPRAYI